MLSDNKEEIDTICQQYQDIKSIRNYYIEYCIQQKEYNKAITILSDGNYPAESCAARKEIYQMMHDQTNYLKELWQLVTQYQTSNLNYYNELKEQYNPEEWLTQRQHLFTKIKDPYTLASLYHEEQLYDLLLEQVLSSDGLTILNTYLYDLIDAYPQPILYKYETEVERMAARPGARKKYQNIVSILRQMTNIEGGMKVVNQLIHKWQNLYRSRPAMMDELRKVYSC